MIYNLRDTAKVVLIEKFIEIQALPQETRKTSDKQSNLTSKGTRKKKDEKKKKKGTRKRRTKKINRRKERKKIRSEIRETETKKILKRSLEETDLRAKSQFFKKISKTDRPLARFIKKKDTKSE